MNKKGNNSKQIFIAVLMFSVLACNTGQNTSTDNNKKSWDFLKTNGSDLVFQDKSIINTRLYDMNYIETLKDSLGNSFIVLSGRTCKECDENISIFILNPEDTLRPLSELPKYSYPGKEYDYENNQLNFESRLFIGDYLNSICHSICLIWLQKFKNSSNELDSSMFIVDVFNGQLREREIKSQSQEYSGNLQYLINCKEIKGIRTTSEP